jgi:hypothetical protein
MGEKPTVAEMGRVILTAGWPASRREPRRRYPVRGARRLFRIGILLLGGMIILTGCQNHGSGTEGEHRDGFYAGVSGGLSRP